MAALTPASADNPLLVTTGLPPFDRIAPEHIVPAVRQLLAEAESQVAALERDVTPTWSGLIEPLDEIGRRFEYTWSPVGHLFGVKNSPELRAAYEEVLPEIVEFGLRIKQSERLYGALKAIQEGQGGEENREQLDEAQRRIINEKVLDAELAGIGLQGQARKQFNACARELSELATTFSNHLLDATKAWSLTITDPAQTEGLPATLLGMAAQAYNQKKPDDDPEATPEHGPWKITLDAPSFVPFMKHCRNRDLRERVYRAYVTRASENEFDNTDLCRRILKLRREQAGLLGYNNYAEVSLAQKMARSADAVQVMFETLRAAAWEPARRDLEAIQTLAMATGQVEPVTQWDVAFWAERLREREFDFTEEELRPYFPHERVLDGLFSLVDRLFGVRVVPADDEAPKWHPHVRFFEVRSEDGDTIAAFYYDPYSRPEDKRGGAWMDNCLSRRWIKPEPDTFSLAGGVHGGGETQFPPSDPRHSDDVDDVDQLASSVRRSTAGADDEGQRTLQIPVAHLVCNCTPPVGSKPSLMTFREVETLFHEFGHGLQHMLTTVDYPDAAGLSGVEWDAVELPSQFMENWCYHRPTLLGMTAHYETGEPLPEELFEKICRARTFRAGSDFLRQLSLGMTDMALYTEFDPDGDESIFEVQRRVMEKTSILPMFEQDRFLCSFQHIFAGGYAAGYYSYKWAEVLSADAFGAFEEAGLDNAAAVRKTGRRFRDTILAQGGSRHPMDVYKAFRGREPSPEALLRHNGLIAEN